MDGPEKQGETEENKALYFRFATAPSAAGTEALADILDPGFIDHSASGPLVELFADPSLEVRTVVQDLLAEGDRVTARILVHWTRSGSDGSGIGELEFIEIVRVSKGRIVELWRQPDEQALVQRWARGAESAAQ